VKVEDDYSKAIVTPWVNPVRQNQGIRSASVVEAAHEKCTHTDNFLSR
jgi:hypothetical protein